MPLIIITGLPCSGKTTIAHKLKTFFETKKKIKTKIACEENFYTSEENRNTIYSDSNKEKKLRASLKSGIERDLNDESMLIVDSSNYVKGYRYELFCVSKCNRTTQCTIYCSVSSTDAKAINAKRNDTESYEDTVLEGLFMRYEEPDGKNRWDAPLFHVPLIIKQASENAVLGEEKEINKELEDIETMNNLNNKSAGDSGGHSKNQNKSSTAEEVLFQEVHDSLYLRKCPKPHLSTVPTPILPVNFVHEVDNVTKAVLQEILDKQQNCVPGDKIVINNSDHHVEFTRPFTMAELQRLRRQYVAYSRTRPISTPSLIPSSFVQYVNSRTDL